MGMHCSVAELPGTPPCVSVIDVTKLEEEDFTAWVIIGDHSALLQFYALSHVCLYVKYRWIWSYKKKIKFSAIEQDHCEQGCYMKGKYFSPFP